MLDEGLEVGVQSYTLKLWSSAINLIKDKLGSQNIHRGKLNCQQSHMHTWIYFFQIVF